MNKLEAYGKIESGKLHIVKKKEFTEAIKSLKDGRYWIIIERIYNKRSNFQNRYLWGVVYKLVMQGLNEIGYNVTIDEVHDFCKLNFLRKDLINEKTGEVLQGLASTAVLKTIEFMEYLEAIKRWASEYLSIYIPDPGEQTELFNELH